MAEHYHIIIAINFTPVAKVLLLQILYSHLHGVVSCLKHDCGWGTHHFNLSDFNNHTIIMHIMHWKIKFDWLKCDKIWKKC